MNNEINLTGKKAKKFQAKLEKARTLDEKAQSSKGLMGQPKGLYTLFGLELWERFSYLGFQAILALYFAASIAQGGLGYDKDVSSSIVAAFGALLYLLSIAGAWIADRVTGTHRALLWGAIIIAAGHITMGIPAEVTTWIGLGLIIVGTGLLKPNVSTKVGELYAPEDARRDAGFSIYYAGINIGAFLGPLIVGYLGPEVNWHAGFAAAAVGMVLGVIQYIFSEKNLAGREQAVKIRMMFKADKYFWLTIGLVAVVIALAVGFSAMAGNPLGLIINMVTAVTIIAPIAYLTWMFFSPKVTKTEKANLGPYALLLVALVAYNITYFQTGNTLNFIANQHTNNNILGFEFPGTWYIPMIALVEVAAGPLLAALWIKLGKHQPPVSAKVGIGVILGAISFAIIALAGALTDHGHLFAMWWIVVSYIFMGIGDLFVQTSGMSATTKLAPRAFAAQTMAVWFSAMAMTQGLQAQIVKLFDYEHMSNIISYFGWQAVAIGAVGVMLIILTPWMRKRMTVVG